MPDQQLAARLGRTMWAIGHRRRKFGRMQCNSKCKPWTEQEEAPLGKLLHQIGSKLQGVFGNEALGDETATIAGLWYYQSRQSFGN